MTGNLRSEPVALMASRRVFVRTAAAGLAAAALPWANEARAQQQQRKGPVEVDITEGTVKPITIAIPLFLGDDPRLAEEVTNIISADLERSGLFQPLNRQAFIERVATLDQAPRFNDWKAINAQALLVGRVFRAPDGRIRAQYRLWDVVTGRQLAGQEIAVTQAGWRRSGHIIADASYERLTGEKGYFDTRIVFVDETGPKDRRVKRLAIMDQDGASLRLLSQGRELVLTPRFSPTSAEIAFMAFEGEQPRVFIMNIETGQRELISSLPGMSFAPRFSPDGQRLLMSLQEGGGGANLFEMDLRSRRPRKLTDGAAIDTGPCYAPDGRRIVFESDRDGTQQLYVMNADGGGARRITLNEGRYSTPVWSPRGDYIACTKQLGGKFLIAVLKPDGSGERILTEGFHNEGPTWAPNGRVLMFFRDTPGTNGGPKLHTIDLTGYNERQVATPAFASDPAWSGLIG